MRDLIAIFPPYRPEQIKYITKVYHPNVDSDGKYVELQHRSVDSERESHSLETVSV